jgi:NADH-quinone oxidoreductase subunit M
MALQGSMMQMLAHGINVVGLFFVADIIFSRTGTNNLDELGGIRTSAPRFATLFIIILLGSVALPLTNGFVGEFMLLNGIFKYNAVMAGIAGLTIILGAVYMLGSYQRVMLGEKNALVLQGFEDIKTSEKLVLTIICAAVLLMGLYPKALLQLSEPAVNQLVQIISAKQ